LLKFLWRDLVQVNCPLSNAASFICGLSPRRADPEESEQLLFCQLGLQRSLSVRSSNTSLNTFFFLFRIWWILSSIGVSYEERGNKHCFLLTVSVRAILGLTGGGRIPPKVVVVDMVRHVQSQPKSPSFQGNQKDLVGFVAPESAQYVVSLFDSEGANKGEGATTGRKLPPSGEVSSLGTERI